MSIEIRNYLNGFPDRSSALKAILEMDETAFGESANYDDIDSPIFEVFDDDRMFVATDGDEIIGTGANVTLTTSAPGGSLPSAGVTFIGVRPTHRRRGVMSQMLATLHADGLQRNEPVAVLWSADAAIYGRFGYGVATQRVSVEIPHAHAALLDAPDDPGLRLRMIDSADDYALIAPVYQHVEAGRGGVLGLDETSNRRQVYDPPQYRDGATPVKTVVAEDANGVRGYLRYGLKASWPSGRHAEGTVMLYRLMSTDTAAHAALWRYCLSIDLMTKTSCWNVPVDDPVLTWLEQSRQTSRQLTDGLWLRILDLPEALARRTYSRDIAVTVEVVDSRMPANAGTWRLDVGAEGATCVRTDAPPDLTMNIRSLASALLGGPALQSHGDAGWITEHTEGALAATSAAFTAARPPFCPYVF